MLPPQNYLFEASDRSMNVNELEMAYVCDSNPLRREISPNPQYPYQC